VIARLSRVGDVGAEAAMTSPARRSHAAIVELHETGRRRSRRQARPPARSVRPSSRAIRPAHQPGRQICAFRLRIDGVLRDVNGPCRAVSQPRRVAHEDHGELDIAERRVPQDDASA